MPISSKPFAQKKFADRQRPPHGLHRRRRGRRDRVPARQPDLVVSVAQRHAALRGPRTAHRLRSHRHGRLDKLPDSGPQRYTYAEQREYLFALWDQLALGDRIVFVIHDWGSALGFEWASRNAKRVAGIVYMEALVTPVTWADWPENARRAFQGFRSEGGEDMILAKNMFVERVLPGSVLRKLSDEEMAEYRRPFLEPGEDRRPTLTWPRQIPVEGEPADVVKVVEDYSAWLAKSDVPKLFINADPGSILVGRQREVCRAWPNQQEVTVKGLHFLQEDSPDEIGQAVAEFVRRRATTSGSRCLFSLRTRRPLPGLFRAPECDAAGPGKRGRHAWRLSRTPGSSRFRDWDLLR